MFIGQQHKPKKGYRNMIIYNEGRQQNAGSDGSSSQKRGMGGDSGSGTGSGDTQS